MIEEWFGKRSPVSKRCEFKEIEHARGNPNIGKLVIKGRLGFRKLEL